MRGSCLSHSEAIEALKGFIVTSWSGNTEINNPQAMPPEVQRVFDTSRKTKIRGNIRCFILTPDGEVEAVFNAFPNNDVTTFGFDRDAAGKFFAESVRHFSDQLKVPPPRERPAGTLSLPATLRDGSPADARLMLTVASTPRIAQYVAPVAEPFRIGPEMKAALAIGSDAREVPAQALAPVLKLFYPPAIMQNTGQITAIAGKLTLTPMGRNSDGAWAKLAGTATLTLDDGSNSTITTGVDVLIRGDRDTGDYRSVCGILRGTCPKGRHQLEMTGTFSSLTDR